MAEANGSRTTGLASHHEQLPSLIVNRSVEYAGLLIIRTSHPYELKT